MRASADALPRAGSSTMDMDRHGLPANWVCHPKQSMDSSSIRAANNVNERIAGSVGQRCRGREEVVSFFVEFEVAVPHLRPA